jgi:hypothetical protein
VFVVLSWQHKFVAGSREGLANNHLPEFRAAMRKFNARRKYVHALPPASAMWVW